MEVNCFGLVGSAKKTLPLVFCSTPQGLITWDPPNGKRKIIIFTRCWLGWDIWSFPGELFQYVPRTKRLSPHRIPHMHSLCGSMMIEFSTSKTIHTRFKVLSGWIMVNFILNKGHFKRIPSFSTTGNQGKKKLHHHYREPLFTPAILNRASPVLTSRAPGPRLSVDLLFYQLPKSLLWPSGNHVQKHISRGLCRWKVLCTSTWLQEDWLNQSIKLSVGMQNFLAGFQSPSEVFNLFLVEGSAIHLYFPTVYGRCWKFAVRRNTKFPRL